MVRKATTTFAAVIAIFTLTWTVRADIQCPPGWIPTGAGQGLNGWVDSMTTWDPDGSGPKPELLIVGGGFSAAGAVPLSYIGAWDGSAWTSVGGGVSSDPYGTYVKALTTFQGDLFVGGRFPSAGGRTVNNIARWDGTAWHALGTGLLNPDYPWDVAAGSLLTYNDELIVAGFFPYAGGIYANSIAGWNGASWRPLGPPGWVQVNDMIVFQGQLIAAGSFRAADNLPFTGMMAWNGASWQPFPSDLTGIYVLGQYDGNLIAGGDFISAGGQPANHIAKWDGASWSELGGGMNDIPLAMAVYKNELIVGGQFIRANDQPFSHIARWNGTIWQPLGAGVSAGPNGTNVYAFAQYQQKLVVGGAFQLAGTLPAQNWALWGDYCPSGDVNCDGLVNNFDIDPFIMALLDPAVYQQHYPNCDILNADFDRNGRVENFDIDPFVALILGL